MPLNYRGKISTVSFQISSSIWDFNFFSGMNISVNFFKIIYGY